MLVVRIRAEVAPGQLATVFGEELQELPLLRGLIVAPARHAHLCVFVSAACAANPDVHLMLRDEADCDLFPTRFRWRWESHEWRRRGLLAKHRDPELAEQLGWLSLRNPATTLVDPDGVPPER
jgi:hypothetical protein